MLYNKITPLLNDSIDEDIKRLILYDPSEVYKRITLNKFKRWQSIAMCEMWPNVIKNECACGCGEKLKGRQTRWSNPDHATFLSLVHKIINGDMTLIKRVLLEFHKHECCKCHCEPYTIESCKIRTLYDGREYKDYHWTSGLQIDHIVAIKNGGGGCWLGNYQFICHKCHSKKTVNDNILRNKQPTIQPSVLFA